MQMEISFMVLDFVFGLESFWIVLKIVLEKLVWTLILTDRAGLYFPQVTARRLRPPRSLVLYTAGFASVVRYRPVILLNRTSCAHVFELNRMAGNAMG